MDAVLVQLGQLHPQEEPFHFQPVGYDKCCHVVTSSLLPFPPATTGFSFPKETDNAVFDTAAATQQEEKVSTGLKRGA